MTEQKEILEMTIDELRIEVAMLRERCAIIGLELGKIAAAIKELKK